MGFFGKSSLSRLSKATEYTLTVLMILFVLLTVTLPWSIRAIMAFLPGASDLRFVKYLVFFAISGIMAILILWQARCILHIVNRGNPFVKEMVRRLRLTGVECLVLSILYLLYVFLTTRLIMIIVFITFSVVGLLLFLFSLIFSQAIVYKEENELTV